MRIQTDTSRCEGHGLCADVAPEVYDLDEDAVVVLRHDVLPEALRAKAEAGARACPVAVLRVVE
ncbi:hypothetical protein SGFS_022490 [Streptomyces graminofaciens]|uniref:4Fe-4S ferredoxin-type domain-containing protein n=1 Tax=Streptomyces graminofaciens TaxID=68212 RepID=A0ABM7F5C4_9ACTN|nr:ferredoxin [Streptomyces graminofaciens]BBC30955.1 hypothetical protein SGFS_022490 [Streptomyces graminofaciens]